MYGTTKKRDAKGSFGISGAGVCAGHSGQRVSGRGRRIGCTACETCKSRARVGPGTESGQQYLKEERKDRQEAGGRRRNVHGSWSPLEKGAWASGSFQGLPEVSPGGQPHSGQNPTQGAQELVSSQAQLASVPDTEHQEQGTEEGLSFSGEIAQADFPGSPPRRSPTTSRGAGRLSLPYREDGGRPREGPGPTQGHAVSESPPLANPRPFLFSPHPW